MPAPGHPLVNHGVGEVEILSSLLGGEPLPLKVLRHPPGTPPNQDPLRVPLTFSAGQLTQRGNAGLGSSPTGTPPH